MQIIAHRGASWDAPENSLAALAEAWRQGADAAEMDIRLTRDGHLVLMHDADTARTAGRALPVAQSTLQELRQLECGAWKAPRFAGERIPTLPEALELLPSGKRYVIELKSDAQLLEPLRRDLRRAGLGPEAVTLISFGPDLLQGAGELFPGYPLLWLVGYPVPLEGSVPEVLDRLISICRERGFQGLNLQRDWPLDAALAERVRRAGLGLYAWTVNDAGRAAQLAAAGVDGLTTDRPGWLRHQLSR